jgi:beta-lactamase class A
MNIRQVLMLASLLISSLANAAEPTLEQEFARFEASSGGTMGIAALHLESGRSAWLNPDEAFPMASTYKVPIAVRLLSMVDDGELALDQRVDIGTEEYSPGSGMLAKLLDDPGLSVSIHNLLEIMLLISDNTATDRLLDTVGGGGAVTAHMRAIGVDGVRVDRPTIRLIGDWLGVEDMPSASGRTWDDYVELVDALPEAEREQAKFAFELDPRDTATPRGMAMLLEKIWRGEALSSASTDLLIDIMERCETGEARLKGLLPEGTVLAHKTGTIGRTTNDVGVVTLPGDAGNVVVVAFVKNSDLSGPERERAIAEAARAAHDYFLFTAGETSR